MNTRNIIIAVASTGAFIIIVLLYLGLSGNRKQTPPESPESDLQPQDLADDFETTDVSDNTTSNTTEENGSTGGKKPLQFQIDNAIGDTMIV